MRYYSLLGIVLLQIYFTEALVKSNLKTDNQTNDVSSKSGYKLSFVAPPPPFFFHEWKKNVSQHDPSEMTSKRKPCRHDKRTRRVRRKVPDSDSLANALRNSKHPVVYQNKMKNKIPQLEQVLRDVWRMLFAAAHAAKFASQNDSVTAQTNKQKHKFTNSTKAKEHFKRVRPQVNPLFGNSVQEIKDLPEQLFSSNSGKQATKNVFHKVNSDSATAIPLLSIEETDYAKRQKPKTTFAPKLKLQPNTSLNKKNSKTENKVNGPDFAAQAAEFLKGNHDFNGQMPAIAGQGPKDLNPGDLAKNNTINVEETTVEESNSSKSNVIKKNYTLNVQVPEGKPLGKNDAKINNVLSVPETTSQKENSEENSESELELGLQDVTENEDDDSYHAMSGIGMEPMEEITPHESNTELNTDDQAQSQLSELEDEENDHLNNNAFNQNIPQQFEFSEEMKEEENKNSESSFAETMASSRDQQLVHNNAFVRPTGQRKRFRNENFPPKRNGPVPNRRIPLKLNPNYANDRSQFLERKLNRNSGAAKSNNPSPASVGLDKLKSTFPMYEQQQENLPESPFNLHRPLNQQWLKQDAENAHQNNRRLANNQKSSKFRGQNFPKNSGRFPIRGNIPEQPAVQNDFLANYELEENEMSQESFENSSKKNMKDVFEIISKEHGYDKKNPNFKDLRNHWEKTIRLSGAIHNRDMPSYQKPDYERLKTFYVIGHQNSLYLGENLDRILKNVTLSKVPDTFFEDNGVRYAELFGSTLNPVTNDWLYKNRRIKRKV